jgi:ParB/RepB/Spo0J family partition protein
MAPTLHVAPVVALDIGLIDPWKHNPRKKPDEARLAALAESLKAVGQNSPIVVRVHPEDPTRYELADGWRRHTAAKRAGFTTIEARVKVLTDEEMFATALSTGSGDNTEPLSALDEAGGYADAIKSLGITESELARRLGKQQVHINRRILLLGLPKVAKDRLNDGSLKERTAWLIARVPGKDGRAAAAAAVIRPDGEGGVMPSREAEETISRLICRPLRSAPFRKEDETLVPTAGACGKCPYRAGNAPETHGDTSPDTCMLPSCFAAKVEAARERVCSAAAAEGKKRLPAETNAKIFPPTEGGLAWFSDYVEYAKPPPVDLLKPEVAAAGKVPSWSELCSGPAKVQVYVGFDQAGRAVDLVKRSEAIAAADLNEKAIFAERVIRQQNLTRREKDTGGAGGPAAPSPRAEEAAKAGDRAKIERAQKKKDRACRDWLEQLRAVLEDSEPRVWTALPFWRMFFDTQLAVLTDEDCVFVCQCIAGLEGEGDVYDREYLVHLAENIANDQNFPGIEGFAAVVTLMVVTPRVRAEGASGEFVKKWHQAIVTAKPAAAPAAPAPKIPKAESDVLGEWVKAHGMGMSPQKIAATYKTSLEDVCGALQLDIRTARNQSTQLRMDAEEAFTAAGLKSAGMRDRATASATSQRVKTFAALEIPEDLRLVLEMLSRAKAAKPAPPPKADDDE